MEGETPEESAASEQKASFTKDALMFIINAHAATVNMRLYPPTSSMVTETLEKAVGSLETVFEDTETLSVGIIENTLLINGSRIEESDQQKTPIRAFMVWMNERGLSSLEIEKGVSTEELRDVFELLGALIDDPGLRERLSDELVQRGVENVTVNQRVYVAVQSGEETSVGGGGGGRATTALDALKDELLIRYLMDKVDVDEVDDKEIVDILSDSRKVGGLMSGFLAEEGEEEGGILVRSEKAEEAIENLSNLINQVEDESLREMLSGQLTSMVAEMNPRQMTSVLTGKAPPGLDLKHMRENVIKMIGDAQLMDIVDSIIDEYVDMMKESTQLENDWKKGKLQNLNDLLLEVRKGERGEAIGQKIDQALEEAGIEEERDPRTGKRVLSAFQVLGGPLAEEDVDLGEDIDQNVSEQVSKLYSMGEDDLAAGVLFKLSENLTHDSEMVRGYAASLIKETLEQLGPAEKAKAADVLRPKLLENIRDEKDYLAFTLQVDCLVSIVKMLLDQGRYNDAARVLGVLKEQESPDSDRGAELVKHVSEVLEGVMGPEGAVDIKDILAEEDPERRLGAVEALASLGPSAISPLVDIVKDRGNVELRDRALEALKHAGEAGVAALTDELGRENPWYIYRNVLNVIADLNLVEAAAKAGEMAGNPDERLRREAIRTLARLARPETLPVVLNATNDPSVSVRRTAVRVLGMFGDSSVDTLLIDLMNETGPRGKEEDQGVQEAACLALADLQDPSYIESIAELTSRGGLFKKGYPEEVRAAACLALGNIGDDRTVPVLQKAQKDSSMMVRSSAEKALRKLSGAPSRPERVEPSSTTTGEEEPY